MTVSYDNSKTVFEGIKAAGITSISALPETWLGLLLQRAEDDPDMQLIQVAKEEEAVGIAAGAYFAGEPHLLLMQNHGLFGAVNGIVSLAQLYGIPLHAHRAARALGRAIPVAHPRRHRHGRRAAGAEHPVRIRTGPGEGRQADPRPGHSPRARCLPSRCCSRAI